MQECFRILPLSSPWEKLPSELLCVELCKWKKERSKHKKKDRSFTYLSRVTKSRGRTPPFPVHLKIIPINSVLCSLISQETLKWNSVTSEVTAKVRSMVDIWKSRQLSIAKTPPYPQSFMSWLQVDALSSYCSETIVLSPKDHSFLKPLTCSWLENPFSQSLCWVYICFHSSFISTHTLRFLSYNGNC